MARFLFPDDPFIFRVAAPGSPLYSTIDDPLVIYADAGATILADIEHVDHTSVFQSALMLDGSAVIPQFYGPDGVTNLWAKQPEGETFQLTAASGPRLDSIEAEIIGISGVRQFITTLGAVTAGLPLRVDHNLNNPWVTPTLWQITSPGESGVRIADSSISYSSLSPNQIQIVTTQSYSANTVQLTVLG